MDFLQKYPLTPRRVLIIASFLMGALVLVSFMKMFLGQSFGIGMNGDYDSYTDSVSPQYYEESAVSGGKDMAYGAPSMRNALTSDTIMPPTEPGYASGNSEAFEITAYSASIDSNDIKSDCEVILALKAKDEIIFEQNNVGDNNCYFSFKVKKESVGEVLETLKSLDPTHLEESVFTIKRTVDDYTSEIDILKKQLASLDATYTETIASYTNLADMATRDGDVENLTTIIREKLNMSQSLTQSRLQIASELERYERSKADALDRLVYTQFTISITKRVFIDGEAIKDSWQYSIESMVREVNRLLQDVTVGLITFILEVLKFILYALIILLVARFGWTYVRGMWTKMNVPS